LAKEEAMRSDHSAVIYGLLLTALLAGCGAGETARSVEVPMDTVDGTVIVRNGATGVWGPGDAWTVSEILRIGTVEGEDWEQFGSLSGVGIGPGGEIAAIDFQAQHVRLFARDGTPLDRLGGPGAGPGEFDGPLAVAWDPQGRLWVVDGWNRRYTVFDQMGGVLKTIERPINPRTFRQRLVFSGDDAFLDETSARTPDGRHALAIVRVDTTGAVLDTFPPIVAPELGGTPIFPFPNALSPYTPSLIHTVTGDGQLWFSDSDRYRLVQRTLGGDTVRVIETRHRETGLRRVDDQLIDQELRRAGAAAAGRRFGRQLVQGIHTLEDGHILVRIEAEPGEGARSLDIFDPWGRFLGSVPLDFAIDHRLSPAFRGDTMIAVIRDELEVQYIVRAVIERGGG
jgi:sugar lactone lactonase YvrE